MIRATAYDKKGNATLLLGLDKENVRRMQDGKPVEVDLANVDLQGTDITDRPLTRVVIFDSSDSTVVAALLKLPVPGAPS